MHDVFYRQEQLTAQRSAGMENGKLIFRKVMARKEDDSQGIAQGQCYSRTRRRGQTQWAGFFFYRSIEDDVGILGQCRIVFADDSDDFGTDALQAGQHIQNFPRFPALGNGQDDIVAGHHPQIAVDGFAGMKENSRRARAGQGSRNLAGNMS